MRTKSDQGKSEYKKRKASAIKRGVCLNCGINPPRGKTLRCEGCHKKNYECFYKYTVAQKAAGLCGTGCKRPLVTKSMCRECADKHNARCVERKQRIALEKRAAEAPAATVAA